MQSAIDRKFVTAAWAGAGIAVFVFAVAMISVYGGTRYWTNGNEIRTPAAGAPLRRILWMPARPVATVYEADQYEPKVSADGLTMVFVRRRAGSNADLYESRWTPGGWSEAAPIEAVNTENDELGPELSHDGTALYFYSDRSGGLGGYDVWVSKQVEGKWGAATNLGPAVNSAANEYGPALSADGKTLYFASNRLRPGEPVREADGWPATMREKRERHDYDLYRSNSTESGEWGAAAAIESLNTEFDEGAPATSPAGDFLYFASDRPGGLGGFDVYRSRTLDGLTGQVENLGAAVNSTQNDLDPGLSADGFRLYFSSDRAGEATTGVPRYSLWSTASREVFAEIESADRLAQFWNLLVPLLPWIGALLLALIPLALLWWMLRNELWRRRLGRLSLLAQCLLISLLIHAAITAGLAVWKVGSGIADVVRSGGGTRVVLASSGAAGDLGGQLRAGATQTPSVMPALAMITTQSPLRASIEPGPEVELPSATPAAAVKLEMPVDSGAVEQPAPVEAPRLPTSAPAINASMPAAVREASADEANARPARMAELSPASPVLTGGIRVSDMALPRSDRATSEKRDALDVAGMASSRLQESLSRADGLTEVRNAPALAESAPGDAAPLPRAQGSTATEATVAAATSEVRVASEAPALTFSAGSRAAPVALPPMTVGSEVSRLPRSAGEGETAAISEEALNPSGADRLETGMQRVTAQLPAAASPRAAGGDAGVERRATLSRPMGLPSQMSAPISMASLKGVETSAIPLPQSGAGAIGDRLPTDGFGTGVMTESAPSLGGAAIDAGVLGAATIGESRLPADIAEPVKPLDTFEQRQPEARGEVLAKMGGSAETEKAVGLALEWFARHQEADGHWSAKNFDAHCEACAAPAQIDADAAMTGIVLLCYLGAGHTHVADGPYREPIARALKWLVDRQSPTGDLRRGETMYGQTLSTVALCEALAMTKDQKLAGPTRRAVDFVLRTAAARGGATREEDTSVLGWLVMTVESARRAGIAVPRDVFDAAGRWLDNASSEGAPGRYSYVRGGPASAAMTAEAMFVQQILGHRREEARMKESAAFILRDPPKWDGAAPTYHWYYATLALFEQQGEAWEKWNRALSPILVENQRRDGSAAGSWDPQDEWSRLGGRLYQTAVCTLSLEVYYRYKPR